MMVMMVDYIYTVYYIYILLTPPRAPPGSPLCSPRLWLNPHRKPAPLMGRSTEGINVKWTCKANTPRSN